MRDTIRIIISCVFTLAFGALALQIYWNSTLTELCGFRTIGFGDAFYSVTFLSVVMLFFENKS